MGVVAFAMNLCIVFQQKFADLTFGRKVFEAFVTVRAFVAVWIVVDKNDVYPDGRASFFVSDRLLQLCAPHVGGAGSCGWGLSVFVAACRFGVCGICVWWARLFVVPAAFDLAFVLFRFECGGKFGCFGSRVCCFANSAVTC